MHDQTVGQPMKAEVQRDAEMGEQMSAQLNEAADRATFHRVELERWERIGRAAAAGVRELNAQMPVESTSAEDFFETVHSAGNAVLGVTTR